MQKVQILLLDDIDERPAAETVKFALDGIEYEIDLSGTNAEALRKALAPYTEHGRMVKTSKARSAPKGGKTAEVREWAKRHGHHVNERGRIPAGVMSEYLKTTEQ